jgi:hypothetical protein
VLAEKGDIEGNSEGVGVDLKEQDGDEGHKG